MSKNGTIYICVCVCVCVYTYTHMQVYSVAQSCLTLCDPMNCSLPGFPVHGIFQARILEWVSISYSNCVHIFPFLDTLFLYVFCIYVYAHTRTHTHLIYGQVTLESRGGKISMELGQLMMLGQLDNLYCRKKKLNPLSHLTQKSIPGGLQTCISKKLNWY